MFCATFIFQTLSSELSPEEQEEIIKGIEEGMTD